MALQTIPGGGIFIPDYAGWRGLPGFNSQLIDASGERAAAIFKVPKSGTISKVGFRTGTVTTPQTLRVRLETVTSGDPSGTLYGSSTAGTQAAPASNTFYTVALGTGATATLGDLVAAVVDFDSTVGNLNISALGFGCIFPYTDLFTAAWVRSNWTPVISLEYDDGSYAYTGMMPVSTLTQYTYASGSTPDERALQFSLPFPCRAVGCWINVDSDNPLDVVLYEGTTSLTSISLDTNTRGLNTDAPYYLPFSTAQSLTANTTYYLSIKPTSVSNITLQYFSVSAAAVMNSFIGGTSFIEATRTDAGAWTPSTTTRPFLGVVIDQFDDGAGAGGGPVGNNLRGGFCNG